MNTLYFAENITQLAAGGRIKAREIITLAFFVAEVKAEVFEVVNSGVIQLFGDPFGFELF
jgi:hypothetical protein